MEGEGTKDVPNEMVTDQRLRAVGQRSDFHYRLETKRDWMATRSRSGANNVKLKKECRDTGTKLHGHSVSNLKNEQSLSTTTSASTSTNTQARFECSRICVVVPCVRS